MGFPNHVAACYAAAWLKCPVKSCVSAGFQARGRTQENAHGICALGLASKTGFPDRVRVIWPVPGSLIQPGRIDPELRTKISGSET